MDRSKASWKKRNVFWNQKALPLDSTPKLQNSYHYTSSTSIPQEIPLCLFSTTRSFRIRLLIFLSHASLLSTRISWNRINRPKEFSLSVPLPLSVSIFSHSLPQRFFILDSWIASSVVLLCNKARLTAVWEEIT